MSTRKVCKKYIQPWIMRFLSVINLVECVYHSYFALFIRNATLRKAEIQYVQSDHQNEWHQCMAPTRIYAVGSKAAENASTTATMRTPLLYEAIPLAPWEEDEPEAEANNKFICIMKSIWFLLIFNLTI